MILICAKCKEIPFSLLICVSVGWDCSEKLIRRRRWKVNWVWKRQQKMFVKRRCSFVHLSYHHLTLGRIITERFVVSFSVSGANKYEERHKWEIILKWIINFEKFDCFRGQCAQIQKVKLVCVYGLIFNVVCLVFHREKVL